MYDFIRKLYYLLDAHERRNALILFTTMAGTSVIEAMGVASIMPFIAILSNPEVIQKNAFLYYFYQKFSFNSPDKYLLFIGVLVFFTILIGLTLKAFLQYGIARFSRLREYSLSTRILQSFLYQPYSWFIQRHSAELIKTSLSEVTQVINQNLIPTAQFFANAMLSACLIVLLFYVNPWIAMFSAAFMGGAYALIYLALHKYLGRIGDDLVQANQDRYKIAQEALIGIKTIKATGLEAVYIDNFDKPSHRYARQQAVNMIIGQMPRFVIEALMFGGILLITLFLLYVENGKLEQVLPTLAVFAFAGQRLLPSLSLVYASATSMRFGKAALDSFYSDLMESVFDSKNLRQMRQTQHTVPLGLKQSIEIVNIDFRYPKSDKVLLKDINLKINAKNTIGLVGHTGAGKTTIIDIILGLLIPDHGKLLIDGVLINSENMTAWQRSIGYVPQQVFLVDDTVAANIAFGIKNKHINMEAVEQAARITELHSFVTKDLPKGYETIIGEQGIRLSGGQRQRIGIARALYHDPDVLILDEATSFLDNITENTIMQAIHNIGKNKTIILVAHRLSTVQNCDCLYLFEHGRLVTKGTYQELYDTSEKFKELVLAKKKGMKKYKADYSMPQ